MVVVVVLWDAPVIHDILLCLVFFVATSSLRSYKMAFVLFIFSRFLVKTIRLSHNGRIIMFINIQSLVSVIPRASHRPDLNCYQCL